MVLDQPIDDEIEPIDDKTEEGSERNDELGRLHLRRRDTIHQLSKIPPIQIGSLASIVTFFSRTFSETRVASQGTPNVYEIREKQSFNRLFEGAGLNQRETWFPTLPKNVWVLSQLHDFVQVCFSEFSCCRAPVLSAGYVNYSACYLQRPCPGGGEPVPCLVADALGAISTIDRQLFLIHNLLILRVIVDRAPKDEPRVVGDDAYSEGGCDRWVHPSLCVGY